MDITFVRDLPRSGTGAMQKLYRLTPALAYEGAEVDHVVASAVVVCGEPETYIFRSDADGKILDWGELPGSYRGGLDHAEAIAGLLAWAAEATP